MGTFTKLALALALPLFTLSAAAAPKAEKGNGLPDIANMRYQAKNYKTLFNSDRSAKIGEINKLMAAKSQKGPAKASSNKPDFSLPVSDQYEYLDGPDGSIYFGSAEFETEEIVENEYYTRKDITGYKFTIYDSDFKTVGEIKGKVIFDTTTNPDNPETRIASMGLAPVITKKFFNSDEKLEVLVYFHYNTPNYTVNSRSVAFQLGGNKDEDGNDVPICTIQGNLCDVLEAPANQWSEDFYLSFATDYVFPSDPDDESFAAYVNSLGAKIETYKKVGYGNSEPAKIFEYIMRLNDWPGDQESATPMISRAIDGKPYFFINGYTDGLWQFGESEEYGYPEQIWNENTNFFVEVYQPTSLDNPNLIQRTEIEMHRSPGDNIYATFYYLGNLGYRDDVNYKYSDEEGKANLVITTKDWEGAEMGSTSNYYLYSPSGELKSVLGQNVDGVLPMSDVRGQEEEYMFVNYDDEGYHFNFLNPFNGNVHHSFDQILPWGDYLENLYANADRVADGDSYKYCFELGTLGIDENGNDIMRLAWINTDGEITDVDEINMGKDVRLAKVYIGQEVLNPFAFDTTPEREYMLIVKRGTDYASTVQEEFLIGTAATKEKPVGNILLELSPDDNYGSLIQVSVLESNNGPLLWVLYYNNITDKYTQELYRLPLNKFAGGEGTAENPYKIATAGDLQCMRDNLSAHYEIINDFDAGDIDFSPLGSSTVPFSGVLKGNGHTISNLNVVGGSGRYNAIFCYLDNASISDITFLNPTVVKSDEPYSGLVAAQMQRSTLSNIHAIGLTVDSPAGGEFGGLVNSATLNSVITDCSVTNASINLPNATTVGGIVADTRTGSTIVATAFSGAITAKSVVGGILGTSGPNAGPISDCHVDADITAGHIVGGIVGDMDQRITIDHCYVEGSLTGTETYGTRIVNKGYAVGGIAGSITTYYPNNESSDDQTAPKSHDVVTNCFVNLESITTPELPEGHQSSVHRIAGFTSINDLEPDWDNITDSENIDKFLPTEAELGFKNNYAVASLNRIDGNVEAETGTTEGKDIDQAELNAAFFESLGFKYGETAESPWNEIPENDPALYHEFGSKFLVDEITAAVGDNFAAELLVISRKPMTEESFIDGFAAELSDESVAEMTGELSLNKNVAAIGFNALKEGNTVFTANVNGTLAKVKFNILSEITGITDAVAAEDALAITFDGATVSAEDATLELYTIDGKKIAAARNSFSLESLANGIYVVTAKDTAGHKATKKFILQ